MTAACLTPRQRTAVLWAEHMTRNTAKYRKDVFEQLQALFSEPEILELTLVCGVFNMNNRIADSLHIDIHESDVKTMKGSIRTNPEDVRGYLQNLLDTWPKSFPEPSDD